jgi:hypothetical protein
MLLIYLSMASEVPNGINGYFLSVGRMKSDLMAVLPGFLCQGLPLRHIYWG